MPTERIAVGVAPASTELPPLPPGARVRAAAGNTAPVWVDEAAWRGKTLWTEAALYTGQPEVRFYQAVSPGCGFRLEPGRTSIPWPARAVLHVVACVPDQFVEVLLP